MTSHIIPTLVTKRLILRGPRLSDLAAYKAFNNVSDVKVGNYRGGRPEPELSERLGQDIAHWTVKGFGMWIMCLKDQDVVLGGAGLCYPDNWPSHELTWWLMPDARGQGFATEASQAVIDWAYDIKGWPVVETYMRDENQPARRLAVRLGGKITRRDTFPDGVKRDVFALPRRRMDCKDNI